MKTITLHVDGMSCAHCEKAVKKAVSAISGVQKVEVSLKNKTVEVKCDDAISNTEIASAIQEQGYDVLN